MVHDQEEDKSTKSADELFTAALGYLGTQAQDWHGVYRPELISSSKLAEVTLSGYRAVILLSLSELSSEARERLQTFVRGGGGLWVALGDQVDRSTFNRHWYDDGGGLSPVSLETLVNVTDTNQPEGSIHPPERNHPATRQLANTTQLDIDQTRLSEYWQFASGGDSEREVWVLLETGEGSPLVVENMMGKGRVLIQAFPLGLQWSNLPRLKSYVVMIHDWLDYLTAPAMARYNLEPGNAITALVPITAETATAKLLTPAGQEVSLTVSGGEENGLVRYLRTQLPGLYRVTFETDDTSVSLPYYVARDSSESDWQLLATADRLRLSDAAGLQFEGATETLSAADHAEPRTQAGPIWGALLLLLLALLFGEQLLSNWMARQRSGVAVTT